MKKDQQQKKPNELIKQTKWNHMLENEYLNKKKSQMNAKTNKLRYFMNTQTHRETHKMNKTNSCRLTIPRA